MSNRLSFSTNKTIIMACREGGTEGGREEEGGREGMGREGEGSWRKREGQYLYLRVGYAMVYG